MRIIARHLLPYGNYSTQAFELDPSKHNVTYIRRIVHQKFKIAPSRQLIKFIRDGFVIRLVEEFPITFYDLTENTILIVEAIEQKEHHNQKYFNKLKILQPISEEIDSRSNSVSSYEDLEINIDADHLRETLLKQQALQNLEMTQLLVERSEDLGTNIIDSIGNAGWNALHCACYEGNTELAKYYIDKGADVNKNSIDGWTPLQLAIKKNRTEIFEKLIHAPGINLNEMSAKGTALHVALREGRNSMVEALVNLNADVNVNTQDDQTCLELAVDQNIVNLIRCRMCKQETLHAPLIVGNVQKVRFLMYKVQTKQLSNPRYMVCDPWLGTLKVYKDKSFFPMGHDTVKLQFKLIHLTQIRSIQKLKNQWFAPSFFFIEIIFSHRIMLAFQYEQAAQKWIDKIYQATVFQKLLQDYFKNVENSQELITQLQELNDVNDYKELEIYDQSTINPEVDLYCKQFYKRFTQNCHNLHTEEKVEIAPEPVVQKRIARLADFEILELLGAGSFGTVYKVKHKISQQIYAMKALKKRHLIIKKQFAVTEANILKESNHPFVLQMHFAFQTPQHLYLVTDYCAGKDLSFLIAAREKLTEKEASFYIAEIIIAINYLHKNDILYRDLKPENVLINEDGHIKLADFGLSKEHVGDQDLSKTFCGSPAYLAPEMVRKKGITKSADVYGIGCVLFELLTGEAPFMDDDIDKLTRKIEAGKLSFPGYISEEAKKIIKVLLQWKGLLDKNPKNRIQFFQQVEGEPFFKGLDWGELEKRVPPPPITEFLEDDEYPSFVQSIQIMDHDYTHDNQHVNFVQNFSYTR